MLQGNKKALKLLSFKAFFVSGGINLDIFVYQPESESCGANPIRKRGVAE